METRRIFLHERCKCFGALTRRRRFLFRATAPGELGIPLLARAAGLVAVCGLLVALMAPLARAADLGTAFTYQGFLEQLGVPVTDTCDFEFSLWDAFDGPTQIGATQEVTDVTVSGGVFTVPHVDFGAGAFDGTARWLAIAVRCDDTVFVPLTPRVELTPTPYALRAGEGVGPPGGLNVTPTGNVGIGTTNPGNYRVAIQAGGNDSYLSMSENQPGGADGFEFQIAPGGGTPVTRRGYLRGNFGDEPGFYIYNQEDAPLRFGTSDTERMRMTADGNVGIGTEDPSELLDVAGNVHASGVITSGGSITIDGVGDTIASTADLELHVSSGRALRIEPDANSPNLIGGHVSNNVTAGVDGGTISGGGTSGFPNSVTDDFGTVGGGLGNTSRRDATVGGGAFNEAEANWATIAGGAFNEAQAEYATIAGGYDNNASGDSSTIGGGQANTASDSYSTIGGGTGNTASGQSATVGGGTLNVVHDNFGTIGGGGNNAAGQIRPGDDTNVYATVGGGQGNDAVSSFCTVGGGLDNWAGSC